MRTALPLAVLATTLACSLFTAPAHSAARDRVFVASYGSDSNPCTFGSPCKTFQQAVNVVPAGGEVTAIDSAGFGPISITKAVTITSPDGVEAGIVPTSGGNAITINAGSSDAVVLRGLTLNGSGVGLKGIEFDAGKSLIVKNSHIQQFTDTGIYFAPSTQSSLFVSDTLVADNGFDGIAVFPTSAGVSVTADFNHVEAINNANNGIGINSTSGTNFIDATASESVAAGNANVGFNALAAGDSTFFTLFHCVAAHNSIGIQATGSGAILFVEQSNLNRNLSFSWQNSSSGVINTYGDNYDSVSGSGSLSPASKF
jgi:hypothetical protein